MSEIRGAKADTRYSDMDITLEIDTFDKELIRLNKEILNYNLEQDSFLNRYYYSGLIKSFNPTITGTKDNITKEFVTFHEEYEKLIKGMPTMLDSSIISFKKFDYAYVNDMYYSKEEASAYQRFAVLNAKKIKSGEEVNERTLTLLKELNLDKIAHQETRLVLADYLSMQTENNSVKDKITNYMKQIIKYSNAITDIDQLKSIRSILEDLSLQICSSETEKGKKV